jgi:hypothetical protein
MAKSTNLFLYTLIALVGLVLCGVAAWYSTMLRKYKSYEGFASGVAFLTNSKENDCPLSAERKDDGKIHVQPQNQTFDTMGDYVAWLSSLSAAGSMCVPPYVKGPREVDVLQTTGSPNPGDREIGALGKQVAQQNTSQNLFTRQVEGENTYAKTPINKLDDYEYTRIFQNENSPRSELSKTTVNSLMAKNQWDWSKLPFNSDARAEAETEFVAGRLDSAQRDPKTGVFFKNVEGMSVLPPDEDAAAVREKAAMKAYEAAPASALMEHNVEDVAVMVKKMYAEDPNWEPVVEKVGDNEYRVSELRPKARKEKYAENQDMTIERAKEGGLIQAQVDVEGGRQDPYFDKQGVLDYSNDRFWEYKDFKKWTPGLERMFAPTLDTTNWT